MVRTSLDCEVEGETLASLSIPLGKATLNWSTETIQPYCTLYSQMHSQLSFSDA